MLRERKNKMAEKQAFYVDTNIALDYITGRNPEAVTVLDSLKEKGAVIVSSSFLVMEAADFKKESIYFVQKVIDEKWEIKKITRQCYEKDLREGDFYNVSDWIDDLRKKLKLKLYDFLVDTNSWELAQYISQSSNLAAPDVIHLSSAIIVAQSGIEIRKNVVPCKIFISNDGFLKKEAKKIRQQFDEFDVSCPEILTLSEVKNRFLKIEEAEMGSKGRRNIKKPKMTKEQKEAKKKGKK
jgi:predicted nucleic acid-binding protein